MHRQSAIRPRRSTLIILMLVVGLLSTPAGASTSNTATTADGSFVHHETTFAVVSRDGTGPLGAATVSADARDAVVDSAVGATTLALPSGRIRLQSCIGAYPVSHDEPTECTEHVVAEGASRQQSAPAVGHRATRSAGDGVLVIGFVNVHRWSGTRWVLVATSWPRTGAPAIPIPGVSTVLADATDVPAPAAFPAGVPAGLYDLTAVVSGQGGRVRLTVNGQRVGEYAVSGTRALTVPVWIDGPTDAVGVTGVGTVSALRLDEGTSGFTTRGDRILDGDGAAVVPRGINRTGLNFKTKPVHLDAADFAAMDAAGVDTVRLKLGEHLWVDGHCAYDPAYPAAVDAAVHGITRLGMVALIDLEFTTGLDPCASPGLKAMPDSTSVTFWREVAARYKDHPLVAFGIYNEPHSVSRAIWRDGGKLTSGTEPWPVVGMQELYDTVRATGARNLVYVSGTGWSHDLRAAITHPLDGYGIVYGAHIYNNGSDTLPKTVAAGVEPVLGTYPVVVTEFGSTVGAPFNREVIDWADSHGVGWLAFMWMPRRAGAFGVFDDWGSYRPSGGGWPVFVALAANRDAA